MLAFIWVRYDAERVKKDKWLDACVFLPMIMAMALLLHWPRADKIWLITGWLARMRSATLAGGPWEETHPEAKLSLLPQAFSSSDTLLSAMPPLVRGSRPLNSLSPDRGSCTSTLTSLMRSNISLSRVVSPHTAFASPGRMMLANRPPKQERAPTELSVPLRETSLSEQVM